MQNQSVNIRRAESKDAEDIVAFQLACAKETEGVDLNPFVVKRGVLMVFSFMYTDNPIGCYVVAVNEEDQVVGCCLLQFQFSEWNCGLYLLVESVYVKPSHRGLGILSKIYAYAEILALNKGDVCEIRSIVLSDNTTMYSAIQKTGCIDTGYKVFSKRSNKFVTSRKEIEKWSKGTKYIL